VAHLRLFAGTAFALLVGAIRRGSRLAAAMDARGFDSGIRRTNARGSRLRGRDAVFIGGALAACGAALALSIGTGSWAPVFS
jgi:energy-coupling factor transport system permease protein